jgi:MraZ protein
MFLGEYSHSIDSKGRVFIPARFREYENQRFFVNRGLDGCLTVFNEDGWAAQQTKINSMDMLKKDARDFKRIYFSNAAETVCDKQGRINLPGALLQKAGLSREVVVVGVSDHIEIWDTARWAEYQREAGNRYEEIAENLAE